MFDFHEKRKIRSLLYSKYVIGLIFILAIILSTSVFERFKVEREMAARRAEREAELELLKERAAVLEARVEHLEADRGIEEELRNRFDAVKEGEQVVVIIDGEDDEDLQPKEGATSNVEEGTETQKSFWEFFKFW